MTRGISSITGTSTSSRSRFTRWLTTACVRATFSGAGRPTSAPTSSGPIPFICSAAPFSGSPYHSPTGWCPTLWDHFSYLNLPVPRLLRISTFAALREPRRLHGWVRCFTLSLAFLFIIYSLITFTRRLSLFLFCFWRLSS